MDRRRHDNNEEVICRLSMTPEEELRLLQLKMHQSLGGTVTGVIDVVKI